METKKSLAFIVELVGLFILLIMVIVIVTQVFVMSRSQSLRAGNLTEAVVIAENTAEIATLSPDTDSLAANAGSMENVISAARDGSSGEDSVRIETKDNYVVYVLRHIEDSAGGKYIEDTINVYLDDHDMTSQPVYSLRTGNFLAGE